jgi:two-component system response regulator PilR (NtrC family)
VSPKAIALVVDDEPDILELLEMTLERMDIIVHTAADMDAAKKQLACNEYDLCFTDMKLPDGDGLNLIKHIQLHYPNTPVAMITAHGNMEAAIAALKTGAYDFVSKPVDLQMLRNLVTTALKLKHGETSQVERRSRDTLLGESEQMRKIRNKIVKLARSQAPVYISGASGSGKELVARLIHDKGPRADTPFVPVNCGAVPQELMESEFFGHKKGSFTGANTDKAGLFQAADGGTLFLDEVADLPLHMQVKLLRAIQEKSIRPVGAQTEVPVDVRILSATHKNLSQLVEAGEFRQDLFYRINVIELRVPGLQERKDDIPQLADHFLTKIAQQAGLEKPRLSNEAREALLNYSFPGNVRELENILERAFTLCEDDTINKEDLQLPADTHNHNHDIPMDDQPLDSFLGDQEKEAIQKALEQSKYNKTAAAKLLGISFRQLRYRLKKLGID